MKRLSDELECIEVPSVIKKLNEPPETGFSAIGVFMTAKITEEGQNILKNHDEYFGTENLSILIDYPDDVVGIAAYSEEEVDVFYRKNDGVSTIPLDNNDSRDLYGFVERKCFDLTGKTINELINTEEKKQVEEKDKGAYQ